MYLKEFADAMSRFRAHDAPADAVLDAMVMFAYVDGRASNAEMLYITDLRFGGDAATALNAIRDATERLRHDGDFVSALKRLAGRVVTPPHKEELFAYAAAVLYADLSRSEIEGHALDLLAQLLRIPGGRALDITNQVIAYVEAHDPVVKLPANLPLPSTYYEGQDWPGFRAPGKPAAAEVEPAKPAKPAKPAAAKAAKARVAKAKAQPPKAKPKPKPKPKTKAKAKAAPARRR